ncbi:MAG: acylphosphatase [Candidatus Aminicenantes bacterium]|nr:acylphosphatase [Candidatus Aminicenantes bacterium]
MNARAHILVHGRVQGVFFRDHTQKWASSLGVCGWVKNLVSGQVEILAEGEKDRIEGLIGLVRKGPPLSRVESLEIEWAAYKGNYKDFRITW